MFGSGIEDQYVNNLSASDRAKKGARLWPLLLFLNLGILVLIAWAYFSKIEEVTTGIGRVIPSSQVQVVQTLEGGIVRSIAVREGDIVEPNQVLMQIDDTGISSQLRELTQKESSLIAERIRLEAESGFKEEVAFSAAIEKQNPIAVSAEREVFQSRRAQLEGELAVLENRLTQRRSELSELAARKSKSQATLAPMRKEVSLTERMVKRGIVPEVELLRLQSRFAELSGEIDIADAAFPKIEASIKEAQGLLGSTRNKYVLEARERLARLEAELAVVQETIRAASDRVTRTQLRAPVRGVVNKINTTSIGAVVQPGRDIVEIVPLDDGLLIEAQIRPRDVAFIKTGEDASVKLTAYDYLIYGQLNGKVSRISADTITNKQGEEFFKVIVRTEKNFIGNEAERFPIIPGMVATVDIQTGSNTVLSYLMKPVLRARAEAFRER